MLNKRKHQEDAIASIDTAKALIDKVVTIMEIMAVQPSLSFTFAANPIGFLVFILQHLGIGREKLEAWLTYLLVMVTPSLEIAVKGILLTNLKNMISCSIDPRIPEKYRKQHKSLDDSTTPNEYGIDINIESIDFIDKLSINPLGDFGGSWYFGVEGVEDAYKFARADDMDAFLWFVIHKGKFPNSTKIDNFENFQQAISASSISPTDCGLLSPIDIYFNDDKKSSIQLGNTFTQPNGNILSMCIDSKRDANNNVVHNTIVPTSDDWTSVNWYSRRAYQVGKNLGFSKMSINPKNGNVSYDKIGRKFEKERAICNIQYIDQASSDAPITGLVNNKFRFTILPKPYIHVPNIEEGEAPWQYIKMLFNEKGEFDINGKYTLPSNTEESVSDGVTYFNVNGNTVATMSLKTHKVNVEDYKENLVKILIECYPGLTVFEFNYDYLMSIKLFDPKVLAHTLMETTLNMNMGPAVSIVQRHQEATETIKSVVKSILESDDSEISDCYFTFDGSKYDSLLRKAEEKRARQERFGNTTHESGLFQSVDDILSEYDSNAELNEQIDVLHRAITQASVVICEGLEEKDKLRVQYNFIFDLVESLTTALVNGILSPKLLMLLDVNRKLMGGTWEMISGLDLLRVLRDIIVAIVKEIRDLIIQELLKLVLKELQPIVEMIGSLILREQMENYTDAIRELINNCPFIWFKLGNQNLETRLDNVDYADIDVTQTNNGEEPKIDNC